MELRSVTFESQLYLPASDKPSTARVEVRWDPLTGLTSRLVVGAAARLPTSDYELAGLAEATRANGETLVFPNLLAYAVHSSVAIYGVQRTSCRWRR